MMHHYGNEDKHYLQAMQTESFLLKLYSTMKVAEHKDTQGVFKGHFNTVHSVFAIFKTTEYSSLFIVYLMLLTVAQTT
jgi:hypothetical protein